jgi:hypothetical protein
LAPPLRAHAADGFLNLSTGLPAGNLPSRWELLKTNAALGGLVKFASLPDGDMALRAEIPLHPESDPTMRLAQASRAFISAFCLLQGRSEVPVAVSSLFARNAAFRGQAQERSAVSVAVSSSAASRDLQQLREAAGWHCSSQRDHRCTVPLDTHRGAHTALITADGARVHVCAELASCDSLSPLCREGLAVFLLTANTLLRLARTSVIEDDAGSAAQLEVLFETSPSPVELDCALEALSVGADLCAPVADLLQHQAAAQLFLSIRGGPRDAERSRQTTERTL